MVLVALLEEPVPPVIAYLLAGAADSRDPLEDRRAVHGQSAVGQHDHDAALQYAEG